MSMSRALRPRPVDFDLFYFWRRLLVAVVAIYCLITTLDRMAGYWRLVHGEERHWGYARKYLVIQLLRVRWHDVGWELTQIALCLAALVTLIWAHRFVS